MAGDDNVMANVPEHAHERLAHMRGKGKRVLFTSDLSVNEFLLIKEVGFEPAGLVVGSSMYHIGYQQAKWTKNEEMQVLTQAMYHARELAMTRMEEEAKELDADGVVGVRLLVKHMSWNSDLAEFVAIGTAVYHRDRTQNFRAADGNPFTSDLSGQDFWTLLKSGYRPVGMVMGNCVYHVAHLTMRQAWSTAWRNCERTNFTDALYAARELAQERMDAECGKLQAEGVDGVMIEQNTHWAGNGHVIEFFTIGTAIAPIEGMENVQVEEPHLVMTVDG